MQSYESSRRLHFLSTILFYLALTIYETGETLRPFFSADQFDRCYNVKNKKTKIHKKINEAQIWIPDGQIYDY